MNRGVILRNQTDQGNLLEAIFLPEKGMNLISYKKDSIQVIDQSTKDLFEQRYAGLGAMIGPHFHHRSISMIPKIENESLFPHISRLKSQGIQEPFSHGIGRYAPWKYVHNGNSIRAVLNGEDQWNGVTLKQLEGQNFEMHYEATLTQKGLYITLSVTSDRESVMGLHTYYALGSGGKIVAKVARQYNDHGEIKMIPPSWSYGEDHTLTIALIEDFDYGFYPSPDLLEGHIFLETSQYHLQVVYNSDNQENSWQLWHPKGKSFVCIEPLSARDPRRPHLTVSSLNILISILT